MTPPRSPRESGRAARQRGAEPTHEMRPCPDLARRERTGSKAAAAGPPADCDTISEELAAAQREANHATFRPKTKADRADRTRQQESRHEIGRASCRER